MSTNLSQQKRDKLLCNIKKMRELLSGKTELIKSLSEIETELKNKKYGLIWEEHEEKVDEQLKTKIPVFVEQKELEIAESESEDINFLIQGDNLHSLYLLKKTHKEKVDLIYIDPPYNTENKEFIYDDNFISKEDGFRHSKWISFMNKRLQVAKELLKKDGIICISIDDNEQAQLKLLCDSIFGEENFITNSFVLDNLKGKTNDKFVTSVGSRLYIYAKNKKAINEGDFKAQENIFSAKIEEKYSNEDEYGFYTDITFKKTGQSKYREDRPLMYYPILAKDNKLFAIEEYEYKKIYDKTTKTFDDDYVELLKNKYAEYEFILPLDSKGEKLRWTSGFSTFIKKINQDIYYNNGVKQKNRPEASEMLQIYASGTPKSLMYKPAYSVGTDDLKNVLPNNKFDFPKPLQLIKDILKFKTSQNILVLDFFAGSGTTAQAVLEMNNEDGGNRKFILCTNNENNICQEVTVPRLNTIITGVRPDNTKYNNKIKSNVKIYKTEFIDKFKKENEDYYITNELSKFVKELIQLENGIDISNPKVKVLYTDEEIDEFCNDDKIKECKIIYIDENALMSSEQLKKIEKYNITIAYIPEYYFEDEIMEVEQW